ncbi:MAG: hypothetical protein FWC79_05240 [Oscillospiraceae bacterium]|nr:hypothetical protein [Oscillospiraceae bacterium]
MLFKAVRAPQYSLLPAYGGIAVYLPSLTFRRKIKDIDLEGLEVKLNKKRKSIFSAVQQAAVKGLEICNYARASDAEVAEIEQRDGMCAIVFKFPERRGLINFTYNVGTIAVKA